MRALNRKLCSPNFSHPNLTSHPNQPPLLLQLFSCFFPSGFFLRNFLMRSFAWADIETKRERGVELEVGLQYLSS